MEKSTMAEEQLLLRQQDCQYLNDFYAELHFAAVQNLLAASAWQSCLHDAPVDDVSNASGVGTYIECLRVARTASACLPSAQGYDSTRSRDAACRQFVAALKWQATGADWNAGPPVILPGPSNRNDSLFDSEEAVGNRPRTVILPAAVTLRGVTRTGFFVNCCSFGWEYRFPFSYIRLNQTILLSAPDLGSEAAEEIELDTVVPESMLDKAVIVTCGRLDFGMTGHYAEGAYCWHTSVQAGRTAAKNSDPAAITGSG